MKLKSARRIFWTVCFGFLLTSGIAQGWEKTYGNSKGEEWKDVLSTADGGYLLTGSKQDHATGDWNTWLLKTDADGNTDWSYTYGENNAYEFGSSLCEVSSGGYILGGTKSIEGFDHAWMVRTDALGDTLWTFFQMEDSIRGKKAIPVSDGGFVLVGNHVAFFIDSIETYNQDIFLIKTDSLGNELWWKTYGGSQFEDGFDILETVDGGLLITGITRSYGAGDYDIYLIKTDLNGDIIWTKTYGTNTLEKAFALSPTNDGGYLLTGLQNKLSNTEDDIFLLRLDANFNELWWHSYEQEGLEMAKDIEVLPSGEIIFTGEVRTKAQADRNVCFVKADSLGNSIWWETFGGAEGDIGNAVTLGNNSGFAVAGSTHSYGAGGKDGYLIRFDSSGVALSNVITGNVYTSFNGACTPDNLGEPFENQLVVANGVASYFGMTDSLGNYIIPVPAGNYSVFLGGLSPYWDPCFDTINTTVTGVFDTTTVNFTVKSAVDCPIMRVDVSTDRLRRCFGNVYKVQYCNTGTIASSNTQLQLTFDPYLQIDSCSIPWTSQYGQIYTFDLGTVELFECGNFEVFVTVDCDSTIIGQTHCVEAHITPDTLCLPPAQNWDGSSLELSASCQGDSAILTITNIGASAMTTSSDYVIIEDHIIGLQGNLQLGIQEDTSIIWHPLGATIRLEATQSVGHPGNSQPIISVEGCGGNPISTGYVVQYPQNDADPFVDIDCRENVGSYDPNDKHAFPTGYSAQHFIEPNTDIEYLIRFQNTGTDTAFRVIVRDTLSPWLDLISVQPGASSHAYQFETYGAGILKFTFHDIMLPDSNVNEPASHGYLKFRVAQRAFNPLGTQIFNRAGIYFDYNAPIITNTTRHKIGENFIIINETNGTPSSSQSETQQIKVFPNPFKEMATFELTGFSMGTVQFHLFDAQGRIVRQAEFLGDKYQFHREGLSAGFYFYQFYQRGQKIGGGKMVLQ